MHPCKLVRADVNRHRKGRKSDAPARGGIDLRVARGNVIVSVQSCRFAEAKRQWSPNQKTGVSKG